MDLNLTLKLALVAIMILITNLPFGYWRSKTKKFSLQWFLAVHFPVPVIYVLRTYAGIEWHLITFPILGGSFFLGQYLGSRFRK